MSYRRSSQKRFIQTILDQFPRFIEEYPPKDQELLTRFRQMLELAEVGTAAARDTFITAVRDYVTQIHTENTVLYVQTPFLWYTITYFTNAVKLLDLGEFLADSFYDYIVRHLRGTDKAVGAFPLIRNQTSINDLVWEQLQYACISLQVPLNQVDFDLLKEIYQFIKKEGVSIYQSLYLENMIKGRFRMPRLPPTILRFFERLGSQVMITLNFKFFGITEFIYSLRISEGHSFEELIDPTDPTNMTLTSAYYYRGLDDPQTFVGILLIPSHLRQLLQNYFQQKTKEHYIDSYTLTELQQKRTSLSLAGYKVGEGWHKWSLTDCLDLTRSLKTPPPRSEKNEVEKCWLTRPYDMTIHFTQLETPIHAIDLFCDFLGVDQSFTSLLTQNMDYPILSRENYTLLTQLYQARVIDVTFFNHNLNIEFSPDVYWLKIPKIPFQQLIQLLNWLPSARIKENISHYYVWTRLTPILSHWLQKELPWTILPCIANYFRPGKWFNRS
ncbi:MAG: hypothetical protein ACFE9L_05770 [Candidatus Hodarchaeota archaeon]